MRLARIALLHFYTSQKDWMGKIWRIDLGNGLKVSSLLINISTENLGIQRQLVIAEIPLRKTIDINQNKLVIIPSEERRVTETAIEDVANIFSVLESCERRIFSATPCIALIPENESDLSLLNTCEGIEGNKPEAIRIAHFVIDLNIDNMNYLVDRLTGVALMSEALGHTNATGKFHEFVRLFELGFLKPFTELNTVLFNYLQGSELGYTLQEIQDWIKLRHPSTHADLRVTQDLVFESDIEKYIDRMEQASYDLLFNKKSWQSASIERRNVWSPDVATISTNGDIRLTQGKEARMSFAVFDQFRTYKLDLNGIINVIPEGFWVGNPKTQ